LLEWHRGELTEPMLLDIAHGQAASEDALAPLANRRLFMDTDPLATTIWAQFLYDRCDPGVMALAENRAADLYLLCDVDVPWVPDLVRYLPEHRANFFALCEDTLKAHGRNYVVLRGSWEQRWQMAVAAVENLRARASG
jgi:HTH-type transcriptional regulator, transcriptional repressor of NAD biosynthesis genes